METGVAPLEKSRMKRKGHFGASWELVVWDLHSKRKKKGKPAPKTRGGFGSHPSVPPSNSPHSLDYFFFVTTYKKCPSCSLFDRNAGGSVNSRRRLAPPRGPGPSRVSAEFGVLELGPTVQREAQPGARGGKGGKGLGNPERHKAAKTPHLC